MTKEEFYNIMCHPFDLTQEDTTLLDETIKKYPYFQTTRILSLSGTKLHNKTNYSLSLKNTAAHAADRTLLFDYMNHTNFLKENFNENFKISKVKNTDENQQTTIKDLTKIEKRLSHTLSKWLLLSDSNAKKESNKKNARQIAIDRFIQINPKLSALKNRQVKDNISLQSVTENQNLMTETLANLYIDQKKYTKARQAFKILSLKYPKKSGYFADKIREIKYLEENKL